MIVYESGPYYVIINKSKNCYEIYKHKLTHAEKVSSIGLSFGIERVKSEIERIVSL